MTKAPHTSFFARASKMDKNWNVPPASCQKETNPIVEVLLGVHDFAAVKDDPGMTNIGERNKKYHLNGLIKFQNIAWDFLRVQPSDQQA